MSEIIERDQNYKVVGAGVSNDADQDILMLRVDPITGYLLIDVSTSGVAVGASTQNAQRDGNYRPVCLAWDSTNEILQEVLTDENGYLLCDVEFV